jgi:biopolymer transport protein ExbD
VLFERQAHGNRRRRGPGLTPLIDVVFLLLVFFMLASRFDSEALLPLSVRAADASAPSPTSPTALSVEIGAQGKTRIEGRMVGPEGLRAAAAKAASEQRPVRVRPDAETKLQSIVDVISRVERAGATDVSLEPAPAQAD